MELLDNSDMCTNTCTQLLGEKWRALSAEERVPYEEQAAKDKARYQREMAAYKEAKAAAGDTDVKEEGE